MSPEYQCTEKETLKNIAHTLAKVSVSQARTEENVLALDKRINGSYDTFCDHVAQGKGWRMAVSGIAVGLIIQIVMFSYVFGNLAKTVSVNERIIQREVIEDEHVKS